MALKKQGNGQEKVNPGKSNRPPQNRVLYVVLQNKNRGRPELTRFPLTLDLILFFYCFSYIEGEEEEQDDNDAEENCDNHDEGEKDSKNNKKRSIIAI